MFSYALPIPPPAARTYQSLPLAEQRRLAAALAPRNEQGEWLSPAPAAEWRRLLHQINPLLSPPDGTGQRRLLTGQELLNLLLAHYSDADPVPAGAWQ